jgi:hypothetical protein
VPKQQVVKDESAIAKRTQMTNGVYVMKRKQQAAVVTTPFVTADRGDDRSAWAMLKLYLPHRDDDELLFGFTDHPAPAVAALASKWAQLRDCGHASWETRRVIEIEITYLGIKYQRNMIPLEVATASTVHAAQGSTVSAHVMIPPGGQYADFSPALLHVALSRVTSILGLFLIRYRITTAMFTKWLSFTAEITREYDRLRAVPKWSSRSPDAAAFAESPPLRPWTSELSRRHARGPLLSLRRRRC